MKNKVLSLVLILMLVSAMFVLTGCGETATEEDSSSSESQKTEEIAKTEEVTSNSIYGEYIDYGIDLNDDGDTTNDWKIFYDDGTNVYIIAESLLLNEKRPEHSTMNSIGDTSVYFMGISDLPIYENTQSRFLFNAEIGTTDTYKPLATLLNTTVWSSFVNEYADYAIGTPTIEMWVASWNEKGYATLSISHDETGYYIEEGLENLSEYSDDNLYFSMYYWLASPATDGGLLCVQGSNISNDGVIYSGKGIRPVVSLKSDVQLTQNADGVWEIN